MKKIVILIGFVLLAGAIAWYVSQNNIASLESARNFISTYQTAVRENTVIYSIVFFLAYIIMVSLSIPGAAFFTLLGGAFFGLIWGTVLVSFASSLGATVIFLISRYLFSDFFREKFPDFAESVHKRIEQDGALYVLALRLIPTIPFFIVNVVCGITRIPVIKYYIYSQIGMFPATVLYVNAGTQISKIQELSDIASPTLLLSFAMLGLLPIVLKTILKKTRIGNQMGKKINQANLIVIGGGSAGLISSYIAAAIKAKVILIEKHKMGGDCLNTGCVPSKALIASAKMAHIYQKSQAYGIRYDRPEIFGADVFKHVEQTIKTIEPNDSIQRYQELGVDVITGCAEIIDRNTVQVGDKIFRAKKMIIASGASPFVPPIEGIHEIEYLTSSNLWNLTTLPDSMAILGGGPIGCELAQSFARLGVSITQFEAFDNLLIREDPEVQTCIEETLKKDGIKVCTGTMVQKVENINGKIKIFSSSGEFITDKILIATGRKANTKGFGLEKLPLQYGRGGNLQVNEHMETSVKGIYAVGDVTGPYQFTHMAEHQAWYATINALFGKLKKSKISYKTVPAITFVDPEVARVGINETEAKQSNIHYDLSTIHFKDLDRAIADKDTNGFLKVITAKGSDKILGATIVGSRAGEMLAEFTLAMEHNIGLSKILSTIHPYPSYSGAAKLAAGKWKKMTAPQWVFPILDKFHEIFR